jgi:hypothetical protein
MARSAHSLLLMRRSAGRSGKMSLTMIPVTPTLRRSFLRRGLQDDQLRYGRIP